MRKQDTRAPRVTARVVMGAAGEEPRGELRIYDVIGEDFWTGGGCTARTVAAKLDELKAAGAVHLDVHLNSPGGDVFEGMAIHTCIAGWDSGEKHVYVDGLAASMASIIAMAGDRCTMSPMSMMMVHNPNASVWGDAEEMRHMAGRLDGIRSVFFKAYAGKTGLSAKKLGELCDAETWMDADQAVELGFADDVSPDKDGDDEEEDGDEPAALAARLDRPLPMFKNVPARAAPLLAKFHHLVAASVATLPKEKPQMTDAEKKAHQAEMKALEDKIASLDANVLALTTQATAAESRAAQSEKSQAELLAITECATLGQAHAKVAGLKEKAAKADEHAATIAKLEASAREVEIKALLDAASKDGRLTPSKRLDLEKSDAPVFMKDPGQLRVFLDCLPKVVAVVDLESKDAAKPPEVDGDPKAELSDEEKRMAKKLRISEAHIKAFKSGGTAALDALLAEEATGKKK